MSATGALQSSTHAAPAELLSVVYASTATVRFSELDLALLLSISRQNNEAQNLTGVLLYRDGHFMQALEGPTAAVRRSLARISSDPRHTGVWMLDEVPLSARRFGSWAMGWVPSDAPAHADAPGWLGSPEALSTRTDFRAMELLHWFRSHATT